MGVLSVEQSERVAAAARDERDRLVKTFAYEYVSFNHDPSRAYLVTNVTDENMLEIEGMAGEFAPHLFRLCGAAELEQVRKEYAGKWSTTITD